MFGVNPAVGSWVTPLATPIQSDCQPMPPIVSIVTKQSVPTTWVSDSCRQFYLMFVVYWTPLDSYQNVDKRLNFGCCPKFGWKLNKLEALHDTYSHTWQLVNLVSLSIFWCFLCNFGLPYSNIRRREKRRKRKRRTRERRSKRARKTN